MPKRISFRYGLTIVTLLGLLAGGTLAGETASGALAAEPGGDAILAPPSLPSFVPSSGSSWKSFGDDQLDSTIAAAVDDYHIPGAAVCVVKGGEVVWSSSYGYADTELEIPVTESTVFMLASISKTFVGIALMQLVEDGLLDLDTNVSDYLPFTVFNPNHPMIAITTRMLLCHTSSIRYNFAVWQPLITPGSDSPLPLEDFLSDYLVMGGSLYRLDNYRPREPGVTGEYCNIAYSLAGYLVEAITGQSLEAYCQQNIFEPLGMTETSWFLAGLDVDHVAVPTEYTGGSFVPYGHFGFPVYPAGQLRTSLDQLAHYLLMFMNQGEIDGVRILETTTVADMMTVQYPNAPVFPSYEWGLGWFRIDTGLDWLWGHTGGIFGVSTMMFFDPVNDYGFIYLTNGDATDGHGIIGNALYFYGRSLSTPTPTLLASFSAERLADDSAQLRWSTPADVAGQGFHVWREQPSRDRVQLTDFVVRGDAYSEYGYVDTHAPSSGATYWLEMVGNDGALSWAGSATLAPASSGLAPVTSLLSWPNPFRQDTMLSFEMDEPARVLVEVYDLRGRRVKTLVDAWHAPGSHRQMWDGEDAAGNPVAAGTYLYRLRIGERPSTLKVTRRQ